MSEISVMDHVTLELRSHPEESETAGDSITNSRVIETWILTEEDWTALNDDIGDRNVDIVAERDVLATKSTYFRALFGDFREASFDRINVNWDPSTFLYLLQFVFCAHYNISSSKVADLLEAAIFFGVNRAVAAVEEWASSAALARDRNGVEDILQNLPYIWITSNTLGHHSLSKFCPEFLAVNFVVAMELSSFLDLPCTLLTECIAHPQLTVHSERQLCEGLLRWYEKQAQVSESGEHKPDMLSQVQRALLPKDFLLGRVHKICHLDVCKSIIRITDYLECLDLSGCYEVTDLTLFTSSAHAVRIQSGYTQGDGVTPIVVPTLESRLGFRSFPALLSSFYSPAARKPSWPNISAFENLKRLDLSQCWRIPQDSLVVWLGEACPNLLELTMINCPQITFSILQALAAVCPLLELVDISLDITHVSCKEVQIYSIEENSSWVRGDASGLWRCSFSSLTKLSLRGHTEISDLELVALAVCSPPLLEIDLSMCTTLTDGGIWRFLKAYPTGLKSFKAKQTAFGTMSSRALTSVVSGNRAITNKSSGVPPSSTSHREILPLATLDLACCYGATEEDLALVLKTYSSITHLNLGETNVNDAALSLFRGTSLQQLDLRDTQVSGKVLGSVIRSNPDLKILDIRGCKFACINEYDLVAERDGDPSTASHGTIAAPLLFQELGKKHDLEDLRVGWRFGDFARLAVQPASHSLKKFSLGIGGTITDASLQDISEHSTALKQLSLSFQVITEDGLVEFLDKSNCLHTLELQYCLVHLSSRGISAIAAKSSNLSILKLERVAPWILDSDISVLSETCPQLSHLSLVGCRALSEESLKIIAKNWCGLTQLKLEECNGLTSSGVECLLQSCQALEILTLRHNGKGIAKEFIMDAMIHFPLLRHLSLDMCDSVANGYQTPTQMKGVLNTLLMARCKPHHAAQLGLTSTLDSNCQNMVRCQKDTIVTQWNVDEIKVYMVKDRL